jgi:hypothetical protein
MKGAQVVGKLKYFELGRNRLVCRSRQSQGKDGALVDLAGDRNRAAVRFRDFSYSRFKMEMWEYL